MQIIDFGASFEAGEISGRTFDVVLTESAESALVFWSNPINTWGKYELIATDSSPRLKVVINTAGLTPGQYQDTLNLIQEERQDNFLVKFEVVPCNTQKRTQRYPVANSLSLPPKLVAVPSEINLGDVDLGEKIPQTITVLNLGGPVWESVTHRWTDYASSTIINSFTEVDTHDGSVFPIKFTFNICTNDCRAMTDYKHTLSIRVGSQVMLQIPVLLRAVARVNPALIFSEQRVYCELTPGSHQEVELEINKTGSRLRMFRCAMANDKYAWHTMKVTPVEMNSFPKRISLTLDAKRLSYGDYMDHIKIEIDGAEYSIPVQIRVIPESHE